VEELAGNKTVNTLPLATIEAFRDHGKVRTALPASPAEIQKTFAALKSAGIDMDQVTQKLEDEGIGCSRSRTTSCCKVSIRRGPPCGTLMQIGLVGLGRMG
jgi:hypothetical protein